MSQIINRDPLRENCRYTRIRPVDEAMQALDKLPAARVDARDHYSRLMPDSPQSSSRP